MAEHQTTPPTPSPLRPLCAKALGPRRPDAAPGAVQVEPLQRPELRQVPRQVPRAVAAYGAAPQAQPQLPQAPRQLGRHRGHAPILNPKTGWAEGA